MNIPEHEGIPPGKRVTVNVVNLQYRPSSKAVQWCVDTINNNLPGAIAKPLTYFVHTEKSSTLYDVSFRALPGEVTAVLSNDSAARRTIVELLSCRRFHGDFGGDVLLTGGDSRLENSIAFVPRAASKLYTAGLTYLDMISYAARLRMPVEGLPKMVAKEHIRQRVMQAMDIMELVWCKDRVIPERPTMRGTLGGELRRLSVAVECINLPPVLILDDPTRDLDAAAAAKLVECLVKLTEKGHTVISSFPKQSMLVFNQVDRVVLISGGRTIYDARRENVTKFFCSGPMDFVLKDGTDMMDFLIDIAEGIERPTGARKAPLPEQLQAQFEASRYFVPPAVDQDTPSKSVLPLTGVPYYGYFGWEETARLLYKTPTVVERALYVKLREREVLTKSLKGALVVGLFCGYFLWGDGRIGEYVLSFLGMPYMKTVNVAANLFLFYGVQFGMQVINVHIYCQKLQVFRYERSAHCCPTLGFWLSYLLAEVPFVMAFALIFSHIVYYMGGLNTGVENYFWWHGSQVVMALLGMTSVVMFAAVTRREIVVRDLFLLFLFLNTLTSGFLFPQLTMRDSVVDISVINPLRWSFEAVMVWKFADYPDGERYLMSYSFENFNKDHIFRILFNFIIFDLVVIFLALIPLPNTLRRRPEEASRKRASSEVEAGRFSMRATEPVKPNIFTRESSSTGGKIINSQPSATGLEDEMEVRGPTVFFHNISFRVPDSKSPVGYKNVLRNATGRFDWGKLGAVLGAQESGKSSLMHILSGAKMGSSDSMHGTIYYNKRPANVKLIPWQRCAFVEAVDVHLRDLTVKDVVTYAMKLRCMDKSVYKSVDLNVKRTLELLQLNDVMNMKTKNITSGQLKRLSIAEEIVHGPSLILLDEPITGLEAKDAAIIMTDTLRELVNQERTVIASFHQPPSAVFDLFDTLALLSKGRIVYMGKADEAASFFIQAPELQFSFEKYHNPSEFLYDVSGSLILNQKGQYIDAPALEHYYQSTELAIKYSPPIENTWRTMRLSNEGKGIIGQENPIITHRRSMETGVEEPQGAQMSKQISFDVDSSERRTASALFVAAGVNAMKDGITNAIVNILNIDFEMNARKTYILLERSWFTLIKREKLLLGSSLVLIFYGVLIGIILGESTNESGSVVGSFCIGALMMIMSNVQFVFFLYGNNEVFLREHSRGLYSAFIRWCVDDIPLVLLRTVQAFMYAGIVHEMLELDTEVAGFYYVTTWMVMLAGVIICECFIYTLPDVRTAYGVIPGVATLLFMFSGLIYKPGLLPDWLAPWLPSVSIIRWYAQALFINEYHSNRDAFPHISGPSGGYSTYEGFLNLFGWGGKSRYYCLGIVIVNLVIAKAISLLVSFSTVAGQCGKRGLKKKSEEDRMY